MDYNKFAYYRANPYHNIGNMPPIAYRNRHPLDYQTEIPQGESHFYHLGRKHYGNNFMSSSIEKQHLLESPQRFPYENRIALDKRYERNLNTIDIQGASSSTLKSMAVKNKWKAREDLLRRKRQSSLERVEATEEEKRRTIANKQVLRNQQRTQLISQRKPYQEKPLLEQRNGQSRMRNEKIVPEINYHYDQVDRYVQEHKAEQQKSIKQSQSLKEVNETEKKSLKEKQKQKLDIFPQNDQKEKVENERISEEKSVQLSRQVYSDPKVAVYNRYETRLKNPTYLSSQSTIYRAGRTLLHE